MEVIKWYAARTRHQKEKKIKQYLLELNIECFIPFRMVVVERDGRKKEKEKPVIPGFIFIRSDFKTALSLTNEHGIEMTYMRDLEKKSLLVVPDKQMEDFMFLLDFSEEAVKLENAKLKRGKRVRVIKGNFAGIEGELIRIKGHKRVVVRLEGLFSLATTYIPASYLEPID